MSIYNQCIKVAGADLYLYNTTYGIAKEIWFIFYPLFWNKLYHIGYVQIGSQYAAQLSYEKIISNIDQDISVDTIIDEQSGLAKYIHIHYSGSYIGTKTFIIRNLYYNSITVLTSIE